MKFDIHGCAGVVVAGAGSLLTMDPGSPGSGPGSSPHGPDVQRVESLTDTLPSPVIDQSHSAKLVASQLQVNISFHLVFMSQLIPYSCCFVALVKLFTLLLFTK